MPFVCIPGALALARNTFGVADLLDMRSSGVGMGISQVSCAVGLADGGLLYMYTTAPPKLKGNHAEEGRFGEEGSDALGLGLLLCTCTNLVIAWQTCCSRLMQRNQCCFWSRQPEPLSWWDVCLDEEAPGSSIVARYKHGQLSAALHSDRQSPPSPEQICVICLEEFSAEDDVAALCCAHQFHAGCIQAWLRKQASCPLRCEPAGALRHMHLRWTPAAPGQIAPEFSGLPLPHQIPP